MPYGWDHPETAHAYETFCQRHNRYQTANQALIAAAMLLPGHRILDVAAGTGRTASLACETMGSCEMVCLEPALAMREIGQARLPQARWVAEWPRDEKFDRILCGAAIWQFFPLQDVFTHIFSALREGGAFAFNIPIQYLMQPDEPGAGEDPWLTQMMGYIADGLQAEYRDSAVPGEADIEDMLKNAGFLSVGWGFRAKLSQEEYRDWLKIPVLTDALLESFSAAERATRIDAAYARCDATSWRWEAWRGWTAWK